MPNRELLVISVARKLTLLPSTNSSITLAIDVNDDVRKNVRFLGSLAPPVEVNTTCERCELDDCEERGAAATIHRAARGRETLRAAVSDLVATHCRRPA